MADPIPDIGARIRVVDGLPEVLADLMRDGFTFPSLAEYDRAMEWALRAWQAGYAQGRDDEAAERYPLIALGADGTAHVVRAKTEEER